MGPHMTTYFLTALREDGGRRDMVSVAESGGSPPAAKSDNHNHSEGGR
jgi:hypothetical protein